MFYFQNKPWKLVSNQNLRIVVWVSDLGKGQKKKKKLWTSSEKGGGDPKVHNFEILNFGKFQVSKWASGMKRLFKVSFNNWKSVFSWKKKWQKWFWKKFTFRGGRWGSRPIWKKFTFWIFFLMASLMHFNSIYHKFLGT